MLRKWANLPVFIITLLVVVGSCGSYFPIALKMQLLAISLFLKTFIILTLPFLIFSFVLSGLLNLKGASLKIILILIPLVCLSNFSGFWISYICTAPVLKTGIVVISPLTVLEPLQPAWTLDIISPIKNDVALVAGVLAGLFGNVSKSMWLDQIGTKLSIIANLILKKLICPMLPLFVLGFIIKMQHEGILWLMIKEYSILLCLVGILAYGYMFMVMFLISSQNIKLALCRFKNLLPGVLIGLFSMSSAAAIPVTITGSEKNLENQNLARFVVPATANMHLLGDCFALPIIGLALLVSFGYDIPSVWQYLMFSLYGVLAKFAAAGIPGGSAIVFLPIFESIFGFSPTMLTAVTAIYVLFDPVATSSNVFGHGMFALLFEKVYNRVIKI
jgi:Na+/H+-dicarboxylate symporter